MKSVPLSSPYIIERDIEAVVGIVKTRYLSIGPRVVEFEKRIGSYVGARYWDRFKETGKKYNLKLIEDSAEVLCAEYKGKRAGILGEVGVFAFYPNKQITTGEGGILVTDDEDLARLARSMRSQDRGESGEWLDYERSGYNFRMDELSAALGCSQMERIEEILDKREKVAGRYNKKLVEMEEMQVPSIAPYASKMSWFVYVIRLDRGIDRNGVIKYLNEEGVQCKPYFTPIHLQPFYKKMFGCKEGDFPGKEDVTERVIALPFFNNLEEDQIDYVVEKLKEGIGRNSR